MQFSRKIVVISGGANAFGQALAEALIGEGARVIIADSDCSTLKKIALRTEAITMTTDFRNRCELKLLIDKVINLFGRIDLFISNANIDWLEDLLLPAEERAIHWHHQVILQMYTAKYLLPYMLNRKCGYIVNTIPDTRLLEEFSSPFYSTLKHIALHFNERLEAAYRREGIQVSVICQRTIFAFGGMGVAGRIKKDFIRSRKLAGFIVDAIRKKQFLIAADESISGVDDNQEKGINRNRRRKGKPKSTIGINGRSDKPEITVIRSIS